MRGQTLARTTRKRGGPKCRPVGLFFFQSSSWHHHHHHVFIAMYTGMPIILKHRQIHTSTTMYLVGIANCVEIPTIDLVWIIIRGGRRGRRSLVLVPALVRRVILCVLVLFRLSLHCSVSQRGGEQEGSKINENGSDCDDLFFSFL